MLHVNIASVSKLDANAFQGTGAGGGAATTVGAGGTSENRKSSVHEKESTLEKRGGTPEPNRRRDTRSGSMSSQTSRSTLEDSYSAEREAKKQDSVAALTQNFCPVTLTVNVFFRQVIINYYYNKLFLVG